jgi:hypothetical protein
MSHDLNLTLPLLRDLNGVTEVTYTAVDLDFVV